MQAEQRKLGYSTVDDVEKDVFYTDDIDEDLSYTKSGHNSSLVINKICLNGANSNHAANQVNTTQNT